MNTLTQLNLDSVTHDQVKLYYPTSAAKDHVKEKPENTMVECGYLRNLAKVSLVTGLESRQPFPEFSAHQEMRRDGTEADKQLSSLA